jgi:hypothetical protein
MGDPEADAYKALRECGLLPWRGPSLSLRNKFRAAAIRTLESVVEKQFGGDYQKCADALRAENTKL